MKARAGDRDIQEIQATLLEIKEDLKMLAAYPNRVASTGTQCEGRAVDVLVNQLFEEIDTGLEKGMVPRCGMRETCKSVFTDLLQRSANMVSSNSVSEEMVNQYRFELEKRRSGAPKPQCSKCFREVSELFEKHIRVTRSMKVYRGEEEAHKAIEGMSEDSIMREVLEPVSNKQRLQIMKMLSSQARPFSFISERSGLRGGNLLFHLQRLSEAGMIIQQHERGDYMLTEKGYKIMLTLSELASGLDGRSDPPAPDQARVEGTTRKGIKPSSTVG